MPLSNIQHDLPIAPTASAPYQPNPQLRDEDTVIAPPFPIQVYPERIQRVIKDCETYMSYPSDLTAAGILAATAIATARTHRLEYMAGWLETSCVWLAIVAPPGSAKSHPLKFAMQPITDRNKKAIKDYMRLQKLVAEGMYTGLPADKQIVYSDFTVEALTKAIQQNSRGIGVYIDELIGWFNNFNRYNAGSEQEFWLSVWSGMGFANNRIGKKAWLEWPAISVVGTIQPGRLEDMGKSGRTMNGFMERILFCYPEEVPVLRLKKRLHRSDTANIFLKNYAPILHHLLDQRMAMEGIEDEDDQEHRLYFEPSADDFITDYINALKDKVEKTENEAIRSLIGKIQTYTLRFALLINRLDEACAYMENTEFPPHDEKTITLSQAERAAMLSDYFMKHGLKANGIITEMSPVQKLPTNYLKFYRALPPVGHTFNFSDAEAIAIKTDISRMTMYRLLNESDPAKRLFERVAHGVYSRRFV